MAEQETKYSVGTKITFSGTACRDPLSLFRSATNLGYPVAHWWGRANSFRCPRGKEPGRGWVLMLKSEVAALDFSATHSLALTFGKTVLTIPGLYIIKATALYADDPTTSSDETCYLVEIADKRILFQMSSINAQFNVRCPAPPAASGSNLYHADSTDGGTAWTWAGIVEEIWSSLPGGGTPPALPYSPDGIPEGFRFIGVSAWNALLDVLDKIGCTVAYNPIAGTFSIVRLGTVQSGLAAAIAAIDGKYFQASTVPIEGIANLPANVKVHFPRIEQHYGTGKHTQQATGSWSQSPAYIATVATGLANAVSGTVLPLWSDYPAVYQFDGTHLAANKTACDTRAAEVAANLAAAISQQDNHRHLYVSPIATILPGSEVAEVRWGDTGSGIGMFTAWSESFMSGESRARLLEDSILKIGEEEYYTEQPEFPSKESTLPPDFGRKTLPHYPPLLQPVKVYHISDPWVPVDATTGLVPGKVLRLDPEDADLEDGAGYAVGEDCLLLPMTVPDAYDTSRSLKNGARYLGRLNGTAYDGSNYLPLYLIQNDHTTYWGIIQSGFSNVDKPSTKTAVNVKSCDIDGGSVIDATFNVHAPPRANKATSLFTGDVVGWQYDGAGIRVIITDCFDAVFKTTVWFSGTVADIPNGWELADGNNGTDDLSGRFIMCIDEDGLASENTIGDTGGHRWHGTTENNHPDHPNHRHAQDGNLNVVHYCTEPGDSSATFWDPTQDPWWTGGITSLDGESEPPDIGKHYGPYNSGEDTDNRPRYYVLAAMQRVN